MPNCAPVLNNYELELKFFYLETKKIRTKLMVSEISHVKIFEVSRHWSKKMKKKVAKEIGQIAHRITNKPALKNSKIS